jgi:hypothetical protein
MIEFTENQKSMINVGLNLTKDDDIVVRYIGNRLFQKAMSEVVTESMDKELLEKYQRESMQYLMNNELITQILNWEKYKPAKRYVYSAWGL